MRRYGDPRDRIGGENGKGAGRNRRTSFQGSRTTGEGGEEKIPPGQGAAQEGQEGPEARAEDCKESRGSREEGRGEGGEGDQSRTKGPSCEEPEACGRPYPDAAAGAPSRIVFGAFAGCRTGRRLRRGVQRQRLERARRRAVALLRRASVPPQIRSNERTTRDNRQPLGSRSREPDAGKPTRDTPAAQRFRHFGVHEHERVRPPFVRQRRKLPVEDRLESACDAIVQDGKLGRLRRVDLYP